jgi:hypothetical protein
MSPLFAEGFSSDDGSNFSENVVTLLDDSLAVLVLCIPFIAVEDKSLFISAGTNLIIGKLALITLLIVHYLIT